MTRSLIEGVVYVFNSFPPKDGVSDNLITSTIVQGTPKVDTGQKRIAFYSYEMVHICKTNTIKSICVPEISLKASNYYVVN